MSMLEALASTLSDMGFVQLALLFAAVGAYAVAINASFGAGLRSGAASTAFVSAIGFSTLAPSFMGGAVFLALAVFSIALFAACAWLMAAMLGLGGERGPVLAPIDDLRAPAQAATLRPALQAVRGFAAGLLRSL